MSDLPRPAGDPSNDPQDPSKGKVPVLQPSDVREQQQVELQTLRQSAPPEPSAAEARAMALVAMMTDGDLSPEERDELRAMFQANPDLLQAYVEQAVAHAVLEWRYMRKEDYADLRGVEPGELAAASDAPQSFEVHGQLSLRPLSGDGSGMTPTSPPGMAVQFIDGPRRRHRRGPLVAGGFLAGAALAAALFLWAPWSQKRQQNPPLTAPPEPQQAAVYVGFDTWSAVGGTLRKQLNPKMVAWTPKGLIYPKLACSGGALKIDAANDQFLWLDLDADLVVPPERNVVALPAVRKDRGQDVAWPRAVPMGTPGTTLYLSFLIRAEQPVASGYCGVSFWYGEKEGNLFVGKARGAPGFSYDFGYTHKTLLDADPTTLATRPISLDTATHLLVARIDFREGQDRFAIYFDPDPARPEPAQPNGTGVGRIALDRLRISAGRGMDRQGGAIWYLDEIRLADRYRAVVPLTDGAAPPHSRAGGR